MMTEPILVTGYMIQTASSSFDFASRQWLGVVVAIGLVALILLVISYSRSHLRGIWLLLAVTLKLAAFALLALTLLEPVWVDKFAQKGANDLVFLTDKSKGLAIADRNQQLLEQLQQSSGWLAELSDQFRLQYYQFGRRLNRVDQIEQIEFNGEASALLTSINSLNDRYQDRPLTGIVVFTDGNATDMASLKSTIDAVGNVPIFPVVVGKPLKDINDLSITNISTAQSAFEDAPLTISLQVVKQGRFESGAEVYALNETGEEVVSESVIFADDRTANVRMKVAGVKSGVSFYRVGVRSVKPIEEVTLENNQRLISVDRGRGPYRVLYVSGRPNWEYKFLRRAISEDAEIDMVALLRIAKREPKFEWRGRTGEEGNPLFRGFNKDLPEETQKYDEPIWVRLNTKDKQELRDGFPRDKESLFSNYRAIIFDDVESDFLSSAQQSLVEDFVTKRGGTVIMLGGKESFRGGDWQNTPIARLLPVYVDRLDQSGPAQYATYDLSREGWLEPWMRLRDNQSDETKRLARMPEFFSVNRVAAIKPGASLLATITDKQRRKLPAIVVQRYGEGKAGAVLVGDVWRWSLKDEQRHKDSAKMWRQLVRWAVAGVPGRLTQQLDLDTEGTLSVTKIKARVRTKEFDPQDDATVKFELQTPTSKEEPVLVPGEPSLEEAGVFTADQYVEQPGAYRLKTIARDGEGKTISELETGWTYNPAAEEFRSLDPNRAILKQLAEASGGAVLELDQLDQLPSRMKDLNAPVMDTKLRPFWHAPWVLLLALCCLVGEWGIRRWKGAL